MESAWPLSRQVDLETPKTYEGCGKLKPTRSVKIKGQQERLTEE